jgi:hypothetical protein
MATTDLGKWMITNGGEYNPDTTYEQLTMVLYQNSTYITLRTVTGIIPNNDKINYILMAQGFSANALADVVAKDTYGVIGDVSGDVSAQNLVDYLTNEVVNNLLKKTSISTVQTNSDNTVPSSSLAYVMQQAITKNKEDIATANSNLASKIAVVTYSKAGIPIAAGDDFFANIPVDIDTSVYRWVFPILSDVSGDNSTKINISNCIWQNTQVHIKGNNQAVGAANISLTGVVVAIK